MSQNSSPQDPSEGLAVVAARMSALEQQVSELTKRLEEAGSERPSLDRSELSDDLKQRRDQLRDYEKALVERIADVDDDRRATASRLQRAWQTQREEIDERLRRLAGRFGGLLTLFAILFAVGLFLVYRQASTGRTEVAADVTEMRQALTQLSGRDAIDEQVREKLDRLTAEVGELAAALASAAKDGGQDGSDTLATESAVGDQSAQRFASEIQELAAEQQRITQAVGALRSALQTLGEPAPRSERADEEPPVGAEPLLAKGDSPAVEAAEKSAPETEVDDGALDEETEAPAADTQETLVAGGDIYALQLIGFFDRKSLEEFVTRKGLPAQVYSIRQRYKGRPWYVVVHSLHDDYAAAEKALSELPADLAALDPWIRPLREVTELRIIETGQASE